ncbi:MAG: phosphopantetheine-binding protein [Chloroflexi bacterium]|nr:phosphopantetheine-binding protein [Chloroflexota bacterium]
MINEAEESTLLAELRGLTANVLGLDEELIAYEANFVDDLGVDSLLALELMVNLEREYKLKLTEEDLREMTCLRSVHESLLRRLHANQFSNN